MLEISDRSIENVMAILAAHGVEAGYLVPTKTGLDKSILDAHGGIRDYFKLTKFHDYATQAQGESGKRFATAVFLSPSHTIFTKASLYRPETKTGDPRIWIYGLKNLVTAGNLLAIFVHDDVLYVVNASDRQMISEQGSLSLNLQNLISQIINQSNKIASELLDRLENIAARGWIPSLREGPTGVGFTLETMLGIAANSSKDPDYKGIEIKAGRATISGKKTSRTTLFSKTPDWSKSTVSNGLGLLNKYGYIGDTGRLQLYCSLKNKPNSLGHYLEVQADDQAIHSMHQNLTSGTPASKVLYWCLDDLRNALLHKHKETFWVNAISRSNNSKNEEFLYKEVIHTKEPLLANMAEMFRLGHIELDYALHSLKNAAGNPISRDHGYLFKIWSENLPSLFPPPTVHTLIKNPRCF